MNRAEEKMQLDLSVETDMQPSSEDELPGENTESEDESLEDVADGDSRRNETISCLENLALSFLSQLTASLEPKPSKDSGYSSNSQPDVPAIPKKITLELANRGNIQSPNESGTRMRSITYPKKGKDSGAKALAQVMKVASEAHEALVNNTPITKRDLYYRDVALFKSQATVDKLVDDLAATFSINRSDLNIRASSKGLFCGSALSIHLHDGTTIVGHDSEPSLIPQAQDIAEFEISRDVAWILVVEKDAVFQTLRDAGLTNHSDLSGCGLIITGKGYPDVATRQLVKTFSDNMPENTRLIALVDADAYGLDILSVYKYGSASMRHENQSLAAQRLEWIGVSAVEALEMGVDRDAFLPITVHDQKKAISLLRSSNDLPPVWKRELMRMLHTRRKAEIEILSSHPPSSGSLDVIDENSSLTCPAREYSSPLVRYVIKKINAALQA